MSTKHYLGKLLKSNDFSRFLFFKILFEFLKITLIKIVWKKIPQHKQENKKTQKKTFNFLLLTQKSE